VEQEVLNLVLRRRAKHVLESQRLRP